MEPGDASGSTSPEFPREAEEGAWWLAGQPLKPQGWMSLGGVRARDVWGIRGRCMGAPGGVDEEEEELGLFAAVGLLLEF